MNLPTSLMNSLHDAPGFNSEAFMSVHQSGEQVTSIRLNPKKNPPNTTKHNFPIPGAVELFNLKIEPFPWSSFFFFLSLKYRSNWSRRQTANRTEDSGRGAQFQNRRRSMVIIRLLFEWTAHLYFGSTFSRRLLLCAGSIRHVPGTNAEAKYRFVETDKGPGSLCRAWWKINAYSIIASWRKCLRE